MAYQYVNVLTPRRDGGAAAGPRRGDAVAVRAQPLLHLGGENEPANDQQVHASRRDERRRSRGVRRRPAGVRRRHGSPRRRRTVGPAGDRARTEPGGTRRSFEARDYGELYRLGAHPYLLWHFAEAIWVHEVPWPELNERYRAAADPTVTPTSSSDPAQVRAIGTRLASPGTPDVGRRAAGRDTCGAEGTARLPRRRRAQGLPSCRRGALLFAARADQTDRASRAGARRPAPRADAHRGQGHPSG